MQNKLRGWLADNSLTADPKDRILVLESAGNAGPDAIYKEMREEDTGLRQETFVHVVTLYERIVARFLMNGFNVNTGLFHAVPRFTGIIEKGTWNPEKNGIYVSFIQDKVIREEIAKTEIVIEGEKADVMYITGVEDRSNGMTDGSMTPGRNFAVFGAYLRVVGDNEAVGITFRKLSDNTVVTLGNDMFSTNDPGKVIFIVPTDLVDGEYELTITTQYMKNSSILRKTPRTISTRVFVGEISSGGGSDRPEIE